MIDNDIYEQYNTIENTKKKKDTEIVFDIICRKEYYIQSRIF